MDFCGKQLHSVHLYMSLQALTSFDSNAVLLCNIRCSACVMLHIEDCNQILGIGVRHNTGEVWRAMQASTIQGPVSQLVIIAQSTSSCCNW